MIEIHASILSPGPLISPPLWQSLCVCVCFSTEHANKLIAFGTQDTSIGLGVLEKKKTQQKQTDIIIMIRSVFVDYVLGQIVERILLVDWRPPRFACVRSHKCCCLENCGKNSSRAWALHVSGLGEFDTIDWCMAQWRLMQQARVLLLKWQQVFAITKRHVKTCGFMWS